LSIKKHIGGAAGASPLVFACDDKKPRSAQDIFAELKEKNLVDQNLGWSNTDHVTLYLGSTPITFKNIKKFVSEIQSWVLEISYFNPPPPKVDEQVRARARERARGPLHGCVGRRGRPRLGRSGPGRCS